MRHFEPVQTLGGRARVSHLRFGVLSAGAAIAFGLSLVELGAAEQLGWLIALPLTLATYGMAAGAVGICALTGLKGERAADHGTEAILDRHCARSIKARAGLIMLASMLVGALGAAGFVASL
jgi:hypothetical protein